MFDDIKPEPEDVFATTDQATPKVASPTSLTPNPLPLTTAPAPNILQDRIAQIESARGGSHWKVIVLVVAIILIIVAAFFLSMKILNSRTPITPVAPVVKIEEESAPTASEVEPEPEIAEPLIVTTPPVELNDETLDTDKDGLTDVRETQLGTNPNSPDTDADELFDREEVEVYKTNPLNADTDGDTYQDGAEVKKGFNPNGTGKLLVIPGVN